MTVQELVNELVSAFNAKDADAYADCFTDDAQFVTVFADRYAGREAIRAAHAALFAGGVLAGATLSATGVEVTALTEGLALCHVGYDRGRGPDATARTLPAGSGVFTLVCRREQERWRLVAATNTAAGAPPATRP